MSFVTGRVVPIAECKRKCTHHRAEWRHEKSFVGRVLSDLGFVGLGGGSARGARQVPSPPLPTGFISSETPSTVEMRQNLT